MSMKGQSGIRVLLMNLRPRLRDIIVDALAGAPDFEFSVDELKSEQDLGHVSGDVVIVGVAEPNDTEVPMRLLSKLPEMSVLMIAIGGETAAMYQLRPHRKLMSNLTPPGLMAAIRQSAAGRLTLLAPGQE
jgi:hypothetical protein